MLTATAAPHLHHGLPSEYPPTHPHQHALAYKPLQARLPEIEELQKQLTATQAELTEAGFKGAEEATAAEAREKALAGALQWWGGGVGVGGGSLGLTCGCGDSFLPRGWHWTRE